MHIFTSSVFASSTHTHTQTPLPQFRDDFEDKLHFFAEECDRLQGFHLLVDWDNGFGGVASCLAEELSDEFGSKSVMAMAASPLTVPLDKTDKFHSSLLNHALCLDSLSSSCSMFYPLSLLVNPWRTIPQVGITSDDNLRKFDPLNFHVCFVNLMHTMMFNTMHSSPSAPLRSLGTRDTTSWSFVSLCVCVVF